jgi:hypothetical protein
MLPLWPVSEDQNDGTRRRRRDDRDLDAQRCCSGDDDDAGLLGPEERLESIPALGICTLHVAPALE